MRRAGSQIAWTLNERGQRNIYVAESPDFLPHRVTNYTADDGQELTNLSISGDGKFIVYVRGGDHGANWPAESNLMPNPTSNPIEPKMQVWSMPTAWPYVVISVRAVPAFSASSGGRY